MSTSVGKATSATLDFTPRGPVAGAASDGLAEAQALSGSGACRARGLHTGAFAPQAVLHEGTGISILQMRKQRPVR